MMERACWLIVWNATAGFRHHRHSWHTHPDDSSSSASLQCNHSRPLSTPVTIPLIPCCCDHHQSSFAAPAQCLTLRPYH